MVCRSRKIRCDRGTPCSNCLRSRNGASGCVYESHPSQSQQHQVDPSHTSEPGSSQELRGPHGLTPVSSTNHVSTVSSHPSTGLVASSSSASTLASQPPPRDVESMEKRIRQLEEQLYKASQGPTQSPVPILDTHTETTTPRFGQTFSIYKTRMYGQSHWFNGVALVSPYDVISLQRASK